MPTSDDTNFPAEISLDDCQALDRLDPLGPMRSQFCLPPDVIYLDGNSLGAMPRAARTALDSAASEQWAMGLVGSWNTADWFNAPLRLGSKLAPLLGAEPEEVAIADSMSVNLFKLLVAGLRMQTDRRVILAEEDNFSTDLYMAQSVARLAGAEIQYVSANDLERTIDDRTAIVYASHVDYRTARMLDMADLTDTAHQRGALVLWNLAHSAGAVPLELSRWNVDFAVGCGYKYLNGGPGAPAFLFVAERHHSRLDQPLTGWFGTRAPFEFRKDYEPAEGIRQTLCGTPPILALAALEASLDILADVDMEAVRTKSIQLSDLLVKLIEQRCHHHDLQVASPRRPGDRGSHIALKTPHAYAVVQALIDRGVIADFRPPDMMRFGLTPLYLRYADIWWAVAHLGEVLEQGLWDRDEYRRPKAVT